MSFFSKDSTEKNLQYDDIAFLHFLLTLSIASILLFGYLVYKRLKQANIKNIKNYKKVKQSGLFTKQLENQSLKLKEEKITKDFYIMLGVLIMSLISAVVLGFFIGSHQNQMIGFDPHQILGVESGTPVGQIKKAYRKLALQLHPDRNPNNPQAHAKFIMVSKAYECLTDEKKKQNCMKYGNPDGETSFQVGIGLPKWIISQQNKFVVLPVVFFILLFVVPMIILKWSNSLKAKDSYGLDVSNYPALYPFYRPEFNASFGFYLLTALKQLQSDKKLTQKQKQQFFNFLSQRKIVDMKYVTQQMSENQIYTLHSLFEQMALKEPNADLCKVVPDLLNSLLKFSLIFAKRINDKQLLLEDKLPINWIGTQHIFMLLQFTRTFYNCSLFNPSGFNPFDYLQIAPQDRQISFKNPLNNLGQILFNKQKRAQHLSLFPQHHRQHLQKQINDLPILKLQTKCVVGKQAVSEFTTQDYSQIYFKVQKQNETSGYCYLPKFPYLKQERYYFLFIYGNNLIHFQQITFEQGKKQFVGKFPFRLTQPRDLKFFGFVVSDCRYGLDAKCELNINVVEPKQQEQSQQIQIHQQDLQIQKQPKNYFEKMLSLEVENPSDVQLSDTEDEEPAQKKKDSSSGDKSKQSGENKKQAKKKKGGLKMEEEKCEDSCCGKKKIH